MTTCEHLTTFVERDWLDRVVAVCDCGTVTEVRERGVWRSTAVEFDDKGFAVGFDTDHPLFTNTELDEQIAQEDAA